MTPPVQTDSGELMRLSAEEAAQIAVDLHFIAHVRNLAWLRVLADFVNEAGKADGAFIGIARATVKVN